MKNQVLSIEQMRHLRELDIDTSNASMCWTSNEDGIWQVLVNDEFCAEISFLESAPTFTLQDMLEMMPRIIYEKSTERYAHLNVEMVEDKVGITYLVGTYIMLKNFRAVNKSILEAAYEMLCWLAENGYLGKEEKR